MNLTPETIIAISGLLTALLVGFGQLRSNRLLARKDEMELMRGEIERLQRRVSDLEDKNTSLNGEIDILRQENGLLREEIITLRLLLRQNGIGLPPSKVFPEKKGDV